MEGCSNDNVKCVSSQVEESTRSPAGIFPGNPSFARFDLAAGSEASACPTRGPRTRACGVGTDTARTRTARATSTDAGLSVRGPCGSRVAPRGAFTPVSRRIAAVRLDLRLTVRTTTGLTTESSGTPPRIAGETDSEKAGKETACTGDLGLSVEDSSARGRRGLYVLIAWSNFWLSRGRPSQELTGAGEL